MGLSSYSMYDILFVSVWLYVSRCECVCYVFIYYVFNGSQTKGKRLNAKNWLIIVNIFISI